MIVLYCIVIQARSVHVSMSPWNCSAVVDGQLTVSKYANC